MPESHSLSHLWTSAKLGDLTLPNRLVMAPMTRDRATPEGVPTELNARYYAQRARFGLIVTEGTQPSEDGQGYLLTPGIHRQDQITGWRLVTDAVHAAGGRIFVQLMHVGRIAHPANTPHGRQPVGPSAITPAAKMFTMGGLQDIPTPRALSTAEIAATIDDFRRAAAAAIEAGADGVEIHGANGYLVHQFLSDNANQRTDAYGGTVSNRVRFGVEVAAAIAGEIGAARTAMRISPGNPFNDIVDDDSRAPYHTLVEELARLQLGYLHLVQVGSDELLRWIRPRWPTALIVNRPGQAPARLGDDVAAGLAEFTSVATLALANPDLVVRLRKGAPLNTPDRFTFYGGGAAGYTDYPALVDGGANGA